jgi:formylglycine-generating enzyme required for sulfatase activity
MATIFISHSSRDDTLASGLVAWLKDNGFDDCFIDQDDIRSGDKWTEALRRAKGACRIVLCLVTPNWLASDECYGEFLAGWYGGKRIIPLTAVGVDHLDEKRQRRLTRVLLEDQGADIGKAGAPEKLDLDAHPAIALPLKAGLRAAGAITKVGLDPYAFEVERETTPEPFPGLASFSDTDADAAIFFGRSQEIAQCLEDLREIRAKGDRRAYVILGASGSGKSSLLKAGLLPRLRRERAWFVLRVFRPGSDPLYNFADAIARSAHALGIPMSPGGIRDGLRTAWAQRKDLRATLDALVNPLKAKANRLPSTTLVALDQAEELARVEGESADALGDYFKAALAEVNEGQLGSFAIALTLRSDSFREFETAQALDGLETRAQHIRALPAYRIGATIEQPAARYGVEIESRLVNALMDDADRQDALPLLAFTLQRLWRQCEGEKSINEAHYVAIGKLSGLIEDAAERALRGIDPSAVQMPIRGDVPVTRDTQTSRVFLPALAQLNDRGVPVRRVAPLTVFDEDARVLIDGFVQWRLLVVSAETVEVAHEALFREWPRFRRWLGVEKEHLEALRGVEGAAMSWGSNGRKDEYLMHRGKRLAQARRLDKLADYRGQLVRNSEARDYLDRCVRAKRWRLARGAAGVAAIVLIALLVVLLPEFVRKRAAEQTHQLAVQRAARYVPSSPILSAPGRASDLKPGEVFRDCQACPEMVVLPSGSFKMGSPRNEPNHGADEEPLHSVTIAKFAVGEFLVTVDEWSVCARSGDCPSNPEVDQTQGRWPETFVSWDSAHKYIHWLSRRTQASYRLLSEAEYEYAMRADTETAYSAGPTIDASQANFGSNIGKLEPVGSYPKNNFGLLDWAGNAWAWAEDCYNDGYGGAPSDGAAWVSGDCTRRVTRGGSWYAKAFQLRSAQREAYNPVTRLTHGGLRVARDIPVRPL